jgi:uracil-DNA glycosylase family 4
MRHCPSCLEQALPASGSSNSPILIIGEKPEPIDMEKGRPFSNQSGRVLRTEFSRLGVDLIQFQSTNIWMHEPNKNENCFKAGLDQVLEYAKGKQAILLLGSECANTFIGLPVSDISGLEVESPMLSAPLVMAMFSPSIVFQPNKGVGEVRLAITKFVNKCKERGIL